ncbi:MAG: dihydroorotase, partial [Bifidobacterium sp.]|nr:dihydroorotase [Bifidobacterium sp.]
ALEAVADGTVDMIATDHAPHTPAEKALGLKDAPNGIIGLETAYAVCNQVLVKSGLISHDRLIELMSLAPAGLMGMHRLLPEDLPSNTANKVNKAGTGPLQLEADKPSETGQPPVDLVILDPEAKWKVDPSRFHSKARNTPFAGAELAGRVMATIKDGRLVFSRLPASRLIPRERI